MDVLNLAHGSFYMLGAYVGLTVLGVTGNFWLALIAAPVALCVIGALIEVVFFRRIYREGHLMQVLLTFGFTLVFVDLIRWRFGPQTHSLPTPPGLEGAVHILGVTFASYKLFVILFASMVALVLVVVVVGGLGSIEGAILGSLLIGLAYAIGPLVLGGFEAASIFAVMAVVLLVRPQGLLGRRQ